MKAMLYGTVLAVLGQSAFADDRAEYNRRAATADMASFRSLDLNGDGILARDEVQGDLRFAPRFDDVDINRDGSITPDEMTRYIERTYGARPAT